MGTLYVHKQLNKALKKILADARAPKPGDFGFAPTPQGTHHRWPCKVVSPLDPRLGPSSAALEQFKAHAGQGKLMVEYILADEVDDSVVPFNPITATEFIPWDTPVLGLITYLAAHACVSTNAVVLAR